MELALYKRNKLSAKLRISNRKYSAKDNLWKPSLKWRNKTFSLIYMRKKKRDIYSVHINSVKQNAANFVHHYIKSCLRHYN